MTTLSYSESPAKADSTEITEQNILDKTNYGLGVYSSILRRFYPKSTVIELSGKQCKPARNPFTDGEKTLNIFLKEGVFVFEDMADPDFQGSPFIFAERYYNINGIELLQKLNDEMYLRIGEKHCFSNGITMKNNSVEDVQEIIPVSPKFSYYKSPVTNTNPEKEITLLRAFDFIRNEKYQAVTSQLQLITDIKEARRFKATNFDYVTFSGTFSKRNDKALLKHSGLLTIDFDHIENIPKLKQDLLQDEHFETELMFISPSGNGLKWIISIDLSEARHIDYFNAISAYINETYELEIDKSGKDISRACFLCYDEDVYINPKYLEL